MRSGEDPSNGGTSSGNASQNAPSLEQLEGYCTSLCERFHGCSDTALDVEACTEICFPPVTIASHTVSCARTAEDYLICLNELPLDDLCTTTPLMDYCQEGRDAAGICVKEYCDAHPGDRECKTR